MRIEQAHLRLRSSVKGNHCNFVDGDFLGTEMRKATDLPSGEVQVAVEDERWGIGVPGRVSGVPPSTDTRSTRLALALM